MSTYEFNPQSSPSSSNQIRTNVVSLDLKDESGQTLQITDLPSDISITIPSSLSSGNATPYSEYFLNPGIMQYHITSVQEENTALKISMRICLQYSLVVYLRYGEKPTQRVFDDVTSLSALNGTSYSDCQKADNNSQTIWMTATEPGKYYIALQYNGSSAVQSRNRRSLLSESILWDRCVKFKAPPPTPLPSAEFVALKAEYDPEKSVNYSLQINTVWCAYWSESEEKWTSEGCKVHTFPFFIFVLLCSFPSFFSWILI